jgi:hypothetical protein
VKNKPKTIGDFVLEATVKRPEPIPRTAPKAPRGPWANMNEEERKAYSQKLIAARKGPRKTNNTIPGRPRHLSNEQYAELKQRVRPEINRIKKKMKAEGQLPEDKRAEQVLDKALETFLLSTTAKDVAALGRLILDFSKAKPAQKIDHTVKTAEDWLDELGADD